MTEKVKLLDYQIKFLESLPEQGMGYQIVDIELRNGNQLFERLVFNSCYLKLEKGETIIPSDIKTITLHERKNYR